MYCNQAILAFLPLGGWELAVVIILALVLFYGKRMPEIGRNLGKSIVEFKKGLSSPAEDDASQNAGNSAPPAPTAQSDQESGKTS